MMDRVGEMIDNLNPRESILLGLLVLVVLPLAAVFLLILPLNVSLDEQEAGLSEARLENQWVLGQSKQAQKLGLGKAKSKRTVVDPLGLSGLEESLKNAKLRPSVGRMANRSGGAVEISFEHVEFALLAAWVSAYQGRWGYDIQTFRIDQHEREGFVDAEFYLEPQQ